MIAKYPFGAKVLVKDSVIGIVLHSYNLNMEPGKAYFIYRVILDARDLCRRCINHHEYQAGDRSLLAEDMHTLLTETDSISVLEVSENELSLYEDAIYNIPGEQTATLGSDQDGTG